MMIVFINYFKHEILSMKYFTRRKICYGAGGKFIKKHWEFEFNIIKLGMAW